MKNKLRQITGTLLLLPLAAYADPARLTDIRVSNGNSSARVTFNLTQPQEPHVFTLENPDRLVVDFADAHLGVNLQKIAMKNSPLKSVRVGYPKPLTMRLVFDLKNPIRVKTFSRSSKVMLDIYGMNEPLPAMEKLQLAPPAPVIVANNAPREMVVVIDPGHGGKDPGAIGDYGTKEKNVVLAVSLRLARLINQQPNMHAVLTRNGDYFVPLAGRLKLARKGKADLFVAIHADSYFNNRANGASIYALSHRGATSVAARWLANRENHSELGGVDLRELEDQSLQLRSVLIDLAQTATTTDSLRLGTTMLDALDRVTNLHYSRVEQAPFMVLKSPDIPSILVELGFLSNPKEEQKLHDEAYQDKLAQALFNGVHLYLKKYSAMHV
jgi:N-acetylmuramoyl-L-alanine amidase